MRSTLKLFIITFAFLIMSIPAEARTPTWAKDGIIIHAAGGIDNTTYTNSLDALKLTLDKKQKVIELDFSFTKDGVLVCTHNDVSNINIDEFLSKKIKGKFTPMTAKDALKKLVKSKHTYLVVDVKENDITNVYKEINNICKTLGYSGRKYRKMIIPQLYNINDYKKVTSIYKYRHYIFSMYKMGKLNKKKYKKVASFCEYNNIKTITIPKKYVNKKTITIFKKYGLTVATHTVNNYDEYQDFKNIGVDVIYTDFLY